MAYRYRGSSGRFSKKGRGKRERVYGGGETILRRIEKREKEKEKEPVYEWILVGEREREEDYGTTPVGMSHFNVVVTGRNRAEALATVEKFLNDEIPQLPADQIIWTKSAKVQGATDFEPGLAEWRSK